MSHNAVSPERGKYGIVSYIDVIFPIATGSHNAEQEISTALV